MYLSLSQVPGNQPLNLWNFLSVGVSLLVTVGPVLYTNEVIHELLLR